MAERTIVLSRSAVDDADRRGFEDEVIAGLGSAGVMTVVVPSVYWLSEEGRGLWALRGIAGDLVLACWLYPRAGYWILRGQGVEGVFDEGGEAASGDESGDGGRRVRVVDLRGFDSPEACVEALLVEAGDCVEGGVCSRVEVIDEAVSLRWYPVLDESRCIHCKQCHDFCLFGVYALDADGHVRAVSPDSCKPGCPACARICPVGAIMFPHFRDEVIAGAPAEEVEEADASAESASDGRDELDDLIDALDELDV